MKLIGLIVFSFMFLSACASAPERTGYTEAATAKDNGYSIKNVGPETYIATYKGNSVTPSFEAYSYTVLAAYEYCQKQGLIGMVLKPKDKTVTESRTEIASSLVPVSTYKGYTSYATDIHSYQVNTKYPQYTAGTLCRKNFKELENEPKFEAIGRELIHDVTKDFHGGLLVKGVRDAKLPLKLDDVLIRVGKERIGDQLELGVALENMPAGKISGEIIRKGKIVPVKLASVDITEIVKQQQEVNLNFICGKIANIRAQIYDESIVDLPPICKDRVSAKTK